MNDNRNMLLAIVLSAMVLLGWGLLSDKIFPTAGPQTQRVENGKMKPVSHPTAGPVGNTPAAIRDRAVVLAETPRVRIQTPSLEGSIDLKGARFDDLVLVKQRETIAKDSPPVRLLSPAGAKDSYFAQFGWSAAAVEVPDANSLWTSSASLLTPDRPVTLSWSNPTGQRFEQIVSVDDGYLFTVKQRVVNLGAGAVALRTYGLASRSEKSKDPSTWTNHVGPISFLGGKADYGVDWKSLDEDKSGVTVDSHGGWLGFTDKYWLTVLAPAKDAPVEASFKKSPSGAYQADYAGAPFVVAPGQAVGAETRLFAGAKEKRLLDRYENQGITKLSKSIDWGWFEWFMRPIFGLLQWLFHTTGNFGVAIICLTFIV
ncbi:MAG: membrane protein insertase YidC, partial [Sphingomicrobium sp.]